MTKPWFSLHRLSSIQTVVLSAAIAIGVFVGGHAVLRATGQSTCDEQCEFIDCEVPGEPGCGGCGQYVEWVEFFSAGDRCTSCGVGWCKHLEKVDVDHCGICEQSFVQQCLTCIIGF